MFWVQQSIICGQIAARSGESELSTHSLHIFRLHCTINPPLSSPKPSALRVCASKHSNSGSMSLCANDTRA